MINVIYFGSPAFSAKILASLFKIQNSKFKIIAAITTPDKPIGRKQVILPTPVAQITQKHKIPLFKPDKLDSSNLAHVKLLKPDIFLVASYGKIIPKDWLDTPQIATLNIHFSLLPKYRGALCISEAIKNQESLTGVTLMEMDETLDTGPIIAQIKQKINSNDNSATLTNKLTQKAIILLRQSLVPYIKFKLGKLNKSNQLKDNSLQIFLPPMAQNDSFATYTPSHKTRTHATAQIPWQQIKDALKGGNNTTSTHALIRSLNPSPGAWTTINNKPLKILETKLNKKKNNNQLSIITCQQPSRSPISWQAFLSGHSLDSSTSGDI